MTEAIVLTIGRLMKSLWRRLHPSVLASQELVQVEEELLNIASSIVVWSDESLLDKAVLASARAIGSMPEFKDTLIDAIATLYFVDQSPEIGATIEHAAKMAIEQESLHKQRVNKYEGMDDDAIDEATFTGMFLTLRAPDKSMTIPDSEPQDAAPAIEEKTFEEQDVTLLGKLTGLSLKLPSRTSALLDAAPQGAHLLSNALMEDWLTGKNNNHWASEPTYDFYRDQRVAEVVRIVPILQKLCNGLEGILAVWSEHAILESLIEVEYSVLENQEELKTLIISWRQSELTCWPKLLEIQDKN
ncbi:hypothetical protein EC968_009338 [Mortierella alpina]|nr:hypothetical protein EC968_009338 [Mortierella alpina]